MTSEATWYFSLAGTQDRQGPFAQEAIIQALEKGQLGETDLIWCSGWENWKVVKDVPELGSYTAPPVPDATATPDYTPTGRVCKNHHDRDATWECTGCDMPFCDDCVSLMKLDSGSTASCKECQKICTQIAAPGAPPGGVIKTPMMFLSSFAYPLKGSGIVMLITGSIFFGLLQLASRFAGIFAWYVSVFALAYYMSYMFKIIQASAKGQNEMPDWPKITGAGADIWWPLPVLLSIVAIYFAAPLGIAIYVIIKAPDPIWLIIAQVLLFAGTFFAPMALLSGGLGQRHHLNPLAMLSAIFKVFGVYLIALAALWLVVTVNMYVLALLLKTFPLLVVILLDVVVSFYFTIVMMRVLGLIYYVNSERLGWDADL